MASGISRCAKKEPEACVWVDSSEAELSDLRPHVTNVTEITTGNPQPHRAETTTAASSTTRQSSVGSTISSGAKPKATTKESTPIAGKFLNRPEHYSSQSTRLCSNRNPQVETELEVDETALMKIHAGAIGHRSRRILSMHMNPPKITGNDWKGLADYMGFDMLEIQNFGLDRDPMGQVMNQWSTKKKSTIGALIEMINNLEREDVLAALEKPLKIDAQNWLRKNGNQMENDPYGPPLQVPEVSGTSYPNQLVCPELRGITLNDRPDGPIETFDAYVCHNPDTDYQFVLEMISAMEKPPYNLRFCTDWRDLVPGGSYATATAELIENRCKRMIVVLSPEFLDSGHCDFQAKFALALSPGARRKRIVPVMLHWCDVPSILRHITLCDYTKEDMRPWFWQRLYCALMQI